ncbi:MAG: type VI secretion system protein [Paraglaciecola sp.]|jgi:type VI secretion system protein
MIFEKTLLERIDDPEHMQSRSLSINVDKVSDSVIAHLRNMFNVRQGSVMTLDDYGMPDFNDIVADFPNAIKVVRGVLKESIRKYEPRLSGIIVNHVEDPMHPLDLLFRVKGELQLDDEIVPIMFETVVGDSGSVKVRS